jgi:glycosyltransferase involved in cell wall biosynthesis
MKFLGYCSWDESVRELVRSNHVLVVPSRSEGTPRVILECMAQGTPAIASNVGGIPDIVRDQENGLLFKMGSETDLLDKILMVCNNRDLYNRLILCSLSTSKYYTVQSFASHFLDAVGKLSK